MNKRAIKKDGKILKLTLKEYELLKLLALGNGKVYSRESLLNEVWGYDYYGDGRTVDVHIHNLRKILSDEAEAYIVTIRGVGYRFNNG
ncbi:winged helix-turn-helix domain-containing protein [endosymbiont 'TC1' of Trimyema compressum]|uniref:winged helix-turn-helix domain-containing protein n=1 Tax=endosymbiont 'TC1' of Trimyema compressum TaxID=243899 RepID=UPI003CCBDB40